MRPVRDGKLTEDVALNLPDDTVLDNTVPRLPAGNESHNPHNSRSLSQPKHILHIIQAGPLTHNPTGRAQRATGKIIPTVSPVCHLDPLPHPVKDHGMVADYVTGS